MSELRTLLSDTTERVLKDLPRGDFAAAWARILEAGLVNVLVPEDKGGFGGNWEDASIVICASGAYAIDWPLAESILASRLVDDADLILPDDALTLAGFTRGRVRSGKFNGEMRAIPYGGDAGSVAGLIEDRNAALLVVASRADGELVEHRETPAGEPLDALHFEAANVQASPLRGWNGARLLRTCAMLRAGQIAGALQAALALSVQYTRERSQFGKPLASFQAIQQQLAVFAEETAAAGAAATGAFRAADRGEAIFEIAAAKLRASQAAGVSAGIAHQVHGAMGFTAEYALSHLVRRLWAWRSEFGNERHWADEIGARVAAAGPDQFWPDLIDEPAV
jgi:acyl-CoA dehydrogenase